VLPGVTLTSHWSPISDTVISGTEDAPSDSEVTEPDVSTDDTGATEETVDDAIADQPTEIEDADTSVDTSVESQPTPTTPPASVLQEMIDFLSGFLPNGSAAPQDFTTQIEEPGTAKRWVKEHY